MPADLIVYVSGHGYGHATRTRAWLAALARRAPGLLVHLRTQASPELLGDGGFEISSAAIDPGVIQPNSLDLDLDASLDAHLAFLDGWEAALEREAALVSALGARLVVGDVPPLAFAAAARAGVPSLAVANFSWDWILERFAVDDPRWGPVVECYRRAYAGAALLLRLPLACPMPAFPEARDVALLVNASRRTRAACRAALGLAPDERRRVVLASFGGMGALAVRTRPEDLSDYLFVCCDEAPLRTDGTWLRIRTSARHPHEDVIHACDAVLGKPGYGTCAEALAHGIRYLCLPRPGFPEAAPLVGELRRLGCARLMPREDFVAGRWREHLDALFAVPGPPEPVASDGAGQVAEAVLEAM